jgi:ERCC4-type nuclease
MKGIRTRLYIVEGPIQEVLDNAIQFSRAGAMAQLQGTLRQRYGMFHTGSVMTQLAGFHLVRTKDPAHTAKILLANMLRFAVGNCLGQRDAIEWMTDTSEKKIDFQFAQEELQPSKRLDKHTAGRLCKYMLYAIPGVGDKPVERIVEAFPTIAQISAVAFKVNESEQLQHEQQLLQQQQQQQQQQGSGSSMDIAAAITASAGTLSTVPGSSTSSSSSSSSSRVSGTKAAAATGSLAMLARSRQLDWLLRTLVPPDSAKAGPGSRSVTKDKLGKICDMFTTYF